MEDLAPVKAALISVSDKQDLAPFAEELRALDVEIWATGGTYSSLKEAGIGVLSLQKDLGLGEALGGRLKTLHSAVFAAILAKREPEHLKELQGLGLKPLDMVVCNFYPFEAVASRLGTSLADLVENIDIGGPSMVRAAAKNFQYVTIVPSVEHYATIVDELKRNGGAISIRTRRKLAEAAFGLVAQYDIAIHSRLRKAFGFESLPDKFFVSATKVEDAKYGENPDQKAAVYHLNGYETMADWRQFAGDVLSFNNHLDVGSAHEILEGFEDAPAAATVKHGHISGFAFAPTLAEAYVLAHSCDPEADFGCTTVLNRQVDAGVARLVGRNEGVNDTSVYTEIVVAPGYSADALEILKAKQKKKMRIIEAREDSDYRYDFKLLEGMILLQEAVDYRKKLDSSKLTFPTKNKPDDETLKKLLAAWEVVRRVPSNGIVIADGSMNSGILTHFKTLGVASFRKRNGAVMIALDNAGERARGAVCASDGFFPFRDNVDYLGKAGINAIIQPGGSVRDDEVVQAADKYGISMAFTHTRAFKH